MHHKGLNDRCLLASSRGSGSAAVNVQECECAGADHPDAAAGVCGGGHVWLPLLVEAVEEAESVAVPPGGFGDDGFGCQGGGFGGPGAESVATPPGALSAVQCHTTVALKALSARVPSSKAESAQKKARSCAFFSSQSTRVVSHSNVSSSNGCTPARYQISFSE